MMPLTGHDPFYVKLLDEHRQLDGLLSMIASQFNALELAQESEPARSRLSEMLDRLLAHVEQHFVEEEGGGVLEEAISRLPRLGVPVAAIERQHGALLRQLRHLRQRAQSCGGSAHQRQSLREDFSHFIEALKAHEAAEHRIAEEAFGNAVGT